MAYEYKITEKAYHDIDQAISYIAIELSNKNASKELLDEIDNAIEKNL